MTKLLQFRRADSPDAPCADRRGPNMLDFIAHDLMNDLGAAQMCLAAL